MGFARAEPRREPPTLIDLLRIFQKDADDPVTELSPSKQPSEGLEQEYHALIEEQLLRGGVSPAILDIEVKPMGRGKDGRPVFLGMVRLKAWERRSAMRLLLGLPVLEARLKRVIRGSWLHEVASFGGLWLHASGQLEDGDVIRDLRATLVEIESRDAPLTSPVESVWSVPKDLDSDPGSRAPG